MVRICFDNDGEPPAQLEPNDKLNAKDTLKWFKAFLTPAETALLKSRLSLSISTGCTKYDRCQCNHDRDNMVILSTPLLSRHADEGQKLIVLHTMERLVRHRLMEAFRASSQKVLAGSRIVSIAQPSPYPKP